MNLDLIDITNTLRKPLEMNAVTGDKILIITDTKMDPVLWQGLAAAAVTLGMEPTISIMQPRRAHATNPTTPILHAAYDPDVALSIYLTSTALAHAPITEELHRLGKRYILMEELTPAMLSPYGPAGADYVAMDVLGMKIAKLFTDGNTVHIRSDNGTDLTASIRGRVGRSIAGRTVKISANGGGGCAFPDGEAHVCPVEGTGEGTIVYDLTAHSVGAIKEPIRLTVKKGMVTNIEGGSEAAIWQSVLDRFGDPQSYNCPAEIAVGLNPNVTPTGSMRTDKKMYGTSHVGIGDTMALGGTCKAKLRLEGVIKEPEIYIDGQLITRGGKILID